MLTFQFIPYEEIATLPLDKKIEKILEFVKDDKIILIEGRLKKVEEAELIKATMEVVDEKFKGIEISELLSGKKDLGFAMSMKQKLANVIFKEQRGMTIIGPASIVREIKRSPDKIQLFMNEKKE